MSETIQIAIIGGSGLYKMEGLSDIEERKISTPFGEPSGPIVCGTLEDKRIGFLPRHGIGHTLTPTMVNYRANIYALKVLGARFIIAVNACGSLKKEYKPGDIVIPNQLVDFTKGYRKQSFFERGFVAHVGTANPFCSELSKIVSDAAEKSGGSVHRGGTFITVEGPRFSSKAESHLFRSWGMGIIGMTTSPEAFLAREAEISYSSMAHITDFDVWKETQVTNDMVKQQFSKNLTLAKNTLKETVAAIDVEAQYPAHSALKEAIMTQEGYISQSAREKLGPIIKKYVFPFSAKTLEA